MQKSKLIQLISSLSPKEFRKLGELVHSPIHNKNGRVRKLYAHIAQVYPLLDDVSLQKERVAKTIFPDGGYGDKDLRAVMSDLAQLAETLLVQLQLEADPFLKHHLLLQAADERGMDKLREEALHEMTMLLPAESLADEFLYHQRLEAEKARYDHFLKTRNRSTGDVLQKLVDNLDTYYLHLKLKYTCEAVNRSSILAEQYQLFLKEEILQKLEEGMFADVPVIQAYHKVLMTLTENEQEEHYYALKDLLAQEHTKLPLSETKVLYAYAQNYCIRKINTGRSNYLRELFELYNRLLEDGIIFTADKLSQWDFKNIVSVGLRLDELEWTEQCISKYKGRLPENQRENALQYNLANLNFFKQQYGKVARILQTVEFTDIFYNLDSRSLLLKTYYELREYDALFSFSDTFSNYLRRNKQISAYQKTVYMNLVKFITRLARVKLRDGQISARLKEDIETSREVADATWLKSKVLELE
jgi:hypothetical protein